MRSIPKFIIYHLSFIILFFGCVKTDEPAPVPDDGEKQTPVPSVWDDDCKLLTFAVTKAYNAALSGDLSITFDRTARTLSSKYLKWIDGEAPDMFVPVFTLYADDAELRVDGQKIVSGETPVSLARDVEFMVVDADGERYSTYDMSLVCPQINGELPVLHFSDRKPGDVNDKTNYKMSALEMYWGASDEGRWSKTDAKVGIRLRGNSTSDWPKKPYRIKFPSKVSPPGMSHAEAKSWVLLANDIDKSQLRNEISFAFSRVLFNKYEGHHDAGAVMFTVGSQHVNLYMGGDYIGIYQMADQVQDGAGRMAVEDLPYTQTTQPWLAGGYLLEASIQGDTSPSFHTNTKGYTIYMKYPDPYDADATGFSPQPNNGSVDVHKNYIDGIIGEAEEFLYGLNYAKASGGWRDRFDEKTLVDYIIVKEFMGDMDGYTTTKFYKRRGSEKLFFGPIWDCDKGLGNDSRVVNGNPSTSNLMIKAGFQMGGSYNTATEDWYVRFWSDATLRAAVNARWKAKKGELKAAAFKVLADTPATMPKSLAATFNFNGYGPDNGRTVAPWSWNWQADGNAPKPASTYAAEITRLRDWLNNREELLDNLFTKPL